MRRFLPALGLLCLMPLLASAAPNFSASLDRETISLGETVTLSLTFEGGSPRNQPTAPPIPDIEYGSTGTSQNISLVNGVPQMTATYTFELKPQKVGEFTIPAIQSDIDGRPVASQPLKLKVEKAGSIVKPAGTEPVFVRLVIPKKEFYVGEVVPVELQCYVQSARDVQKPVLSSEGFMVGDMPDYRQQAPRVTIGANIYNLLTFRVPVRATRIGRLTLGPANWSMNLITGNPDFFGFAQARPVTAQSDTVDVNILPVPTKDAPATFTGAVGNYTLAQYQAGPTNVGVGDPITLKIRIAGQGSWDTVTIPSAPTTADWREFKLYPPTAKVETRDQMQIDGSKYFEQVITPENADVKEIPGFAFSFFDPNARAFRTLQHAPLPIVVRPTAATPQPTIVQTSPPSSEQQSNAQEIVHIKPSLGTLTRGTPLLIQKPVFIAAQAVPALAFMFAFVWRQRKEKIANNPRLLRQREVARKIDAGLNELSQHAQANKPAEFYATVFRLLQEQIGERLDLPASAITESVVADLPLTTEQSAQVQELFQLCNQYRYARQQSSAELQSIVDKLKATLTMLQHIDVNSTSKSRTATTAIALVFLASVLGANAQDLESMFTQANRLYEQGKFTEAAAAYDNLIQVGVVSPALYFNAGNAWFKAGQVGHAIVDYRKAEQLAPRDPDIRANLQFARNHVANYIPALPGNRWTRWMNHISVNEWTVAASVSLGLFFIVMATQQVWPTTRKTLKGPAIALGLLTACLALCFYFDYGNAQTKSGVITTSEAVVRRGPFDESQSAFTVRDGAELLVVDSKDNWLQVADAAHHTGWIRTNQLAVVR
ncbi:MAG: BatD family protein [Limisphaerales bacterium]